MYKKGISANQISKITGINVSKIVYWLKKNNIVIRTISEGVNLYYTQQGKDSIKISRYLTEIINGNLLGDGSVRIVGSRCHYSHGDKHLEYLQWLKTLFENENILCGNIYKNKRNNIYLLQTRAYAIFNNFRNKFYYHHKRIIPKDIELTPVVLRQWYISDGNTSRTSGLSISKSIYSDILMQQLKNIIGNECTYHDYDAGGKYYIPKKYKQKFFHYIGECPVNCYKYKWE